MTLIKNTTVLFDPFEHEYINLETGVKLQGVTSILGATIFKGKYANVSDEILTRAADRGSAIHEQIELLDAGVEISHLPEVERYIQLKKQHNITSIANEFLVSDNERIATSIDMIDSEGNLYDHKTTYTLDTDYLSWQLSICAYLFEKQGNKAGKLYAIWLPKAIEKAKVVEVNRKSTEEIESLIEAYFSGNEYMPSIISDTDAQIRILADIEEAIISIQNEARYYEDKKKELLEGLEKQMEANGVKTFETDRMKITRVLPSTSETIDTKKLKADYPDLVQQYVKVSTKKGFIKLTIK